MVDYDYPKDWRDESIASLCKSFTKQTGFDYSASIKPSLIKGYKRGFIPFIQNKDFEGLWTNFDTDYYVPKNIATNFPRILLNEKCLLISISGKVGNVGVFSNEQEAFIGGAVAVGKFNDIDVLNWVMYYMFSDNGQEKLLKNVKSGSHKNLILDDIRKVLIPIPPKQEQKAIATALSDVDGLIASLETLIAKKEDIKTATMQQLLTGNKRLDGFSGEWEEKKLGNLARITRGASPRPIDSPVWFNDKSETGWVRISDVTKSNKYLFNTVQKLSEKGIEHSRYVEKNNLIMSICATLGRPILTTTNVCIHDGFVYFKNLTISNEYLYYFLSFIQKNWTKNGQTGSQANLNTDLINSTDIYLPNDSAEQQAIATILSDMDKELESLKTRLEKTKAIKAGMMQELLTGKTRLIREGEKVYA